ncbi:MAG: M20 family peptidase [bacterium]|nr:M20 family peptidase [bacterium]
MKLKKGLKILGVVLVGLLVIMVVKTLLYSSRQISVKEKSTVSVDEQQAALHLSGAVQIRSITDSDKKFFYEFHSYLEKTYPQAHSVLKKEIVSELSLIYKWQGSDPGLKPVLLMSHLDVVPVEKGTEKDWKYPAFSGTIAEGFIWGRGTLDIKSGVIGIMEALENLAAKGFTPKRTIYLSFGHDEETGGLAGNKVISALFKSRNIRFSVVLDEGGIIIDKLMPGLDSPVSLVGIVEKGYLTLTFTATGAGGHSSMPPKQTTVGRLAAAIHKLEENPFPADIAGPTESMLRFVGPEMPLSKRFVFANLWFFKPLVLNKLTEKKSTNAIVRTTTAPTMFTGSETENVLPQKAQAVVNFRIFPGETVESVTAYVEKTINDPLISIEAGINRKNPPRVSDVDSKEFKALQKTIAKVFPDTLMAPYLVAGGTDSKYYSEVSDQVFRFIPGRLTSKDLKRLHGTNERISVTNFGEIVKFYVEFIRDSQ